MQEVTMVERVARAIVERLRGESDVLWEEDMATARAAIEAMREPTEAMIDAAEGMSVGGPYLGPLDADSIFERMIDAALSE